MNDPKPNPIKRHRHAIAMGSAAAIVLIGLSAFALVPGVHPVSDTAPRQLAAADPVRSAPPRMLENGAPFSFADLVERVSPAVVTITAETVDNTPDAAADLPAPFRDFFNQYGQGQGRPTAPRKAISAGSGFIIDKNGLVVTNNHVIENSHKITVKLPDGRSFDAKLIGTDTLTDIALLKIKSDKPLPTVEFGDDRQVRVGDWVVAVGNPFGLSNSVTAGIVSSLGRDIGNGPYTDFIQIDAPINRGNSGGPTFDLARPGHRHELDDLFALGRQRRHRLRHPGLDHPRRDRPAPGARPCRSRLSRREHPKPDARHRRLARHRQPEGRHRRPGRSGRPRRAGRLPAGRRRRRAERPQRRGFAGPDAPHRLASGGASASFTVLRNGAQKNITAKIGARPDQRVASNDDPDNNDGAQTTGGSQAQAMGLGLASVTPEARRNFNIDAAIDGVLVTRVDPNSDAGDKGIQPGDVVLSVANKPVRNPRDVLAEIAAARSAGHKSVLLLVATQGGTRFVAVDIGQA